MDDRKALSDFKLMCILYKKSCPFFSTSVTLHHQLNVCLVIVIKTILQLYFKIQILIDAMQN